MSQYNRLVLGTVQLGMDYGIANINGRPNLSTTLDIVRTAFESGVIEFDTARGYEKSEVVLGRVFRELNIAQKVNVTSKINTVQVDSGSKKLISDIENSLGLLGIESFYGLLLHHEEMLNDWNYELGETLIALKRKGYVQHLGISVYDPEIAVRAIQHKDLKMIQVPSNILDRRFENAGVFDLAIKFDKDIYVRSVFLQGLLLINPDDLPANMSFAEKTVQTLKSFADSHRLLPHELALGFVKVAYPNAKILFGAETVSQIKMNLKSWAKPISDDVTIDAKRLFNKVNTVILNPSCWPS
jgi:aryl-alcohol dehydrogenase-like predicted oxidoreductase